MAEEETSTEAETPPAEPPDTEPVSWADLSVKDVVAEVDGDEDRAREALEAEQARDGGPRKTLVAQLEEILGEDEHDNRPYDELPPGTYRRRITRIASQEWLDPFSDRFISHDFRTSPISGAKRIDRYTAELVVTKDD